MKLKKRDIIIRNILLVVISLCIGFGIYSWNTQSLTGNVMPMPFGFGIGVVMSGSMEPDLSVDDIIFVVRRDSYEVGEVVVFQDGYMLVVHEIVAKDGDTVVTKGKANNDDDAPMDVSNIKGEMLFAIPGGGAAVRALKSPFATLVILALAVWLLIRSYRKEEDTEDESIAKIKEEIRQLKEQSESLTEAAAEDTEENTEEK